MSLRSFHIVFVTVSTLLFAFLAVWAFALAGETGTFERALGFTGIGGVILMQVYGIYFLRKTRKLHI